MEYQELVSLVDLPEGSQARIEKLNGGRQLSRRLLGLGLRVGTVIDVVQHRGRGVVVANQNARVALGAGVAEKILLQPLERKTGRDGGRQE
jgi:ferrous iron transport protein A